MKTLSILLSLILAGLALAQEAPLLDYNMDAYQLTRQYASMDQEPPVEDQSDIASPMPEKKKPGRAMLLSAMVPGLGELYAGSKIKAAVFFAIEVAAWTGTAVYHAEGKDLEDQFKDFADENWSRDRYWDWLQQLEDEELGNEWFAYLDSIGWTEPEYPFDLYTDFEDYMGFTHNLPQEKDQQYYEMIGKYMVQFGAGWDDADSLDFDISEAGIYFWPGGTTNNSEYYMDKRGESNDALDLSNTFIQIVMLNHVFSALDAGFTVRLQNKRIETAMNIVPRIYGDETVAMGRVTFKW